MLQTRPSAYSIVTELSDEDQTHVVILPAWVGRYLMPVSSGRACSEVLERGVNALDHMFDVAAKDGEPLPVPRTSTAA